mmetsp:Transcript_64968/g.152034  ORF Transcript_64968/g.152034 Transcript_64968/m.152034 type:complete len:136 (-) Transcript_64968:20-427(-)|eukprot:s2297_g2.t1
MAEVDAHEEARALELSAAFLQYVKKCPHVMESVQAFIAEHCMQFAELANCDEHKLEYTVVHHDFISLLDGHVEAFLRFQGASEADFLAALASVQETGHAEWRPFKSLLDKTDYHAFAKMMQIQANGVGPRAPPPS